MDPITNNYFSTVLNIPSRDELHVIQPDQFDKREKKKKKEKEKRIDENTRVFSFDSETPMCFVSAEPATFGKISFSNCFFDKWM